MLVVPLQPVKPFLIRHREDDEELSAELPNFAENLAANTFATRLTTCHNTLGGSHDGDAKAALNTTDLITAEVHTATGTGDTLQIADDSLVVRAILEINA